MMTSLILVLGTSMLLFLGSLAYAVLADWVDEQQADQKMQSSKYNAVLDPKFYFGRAARPPMRVLGSFIL